MIDRTATLASQAKKHYSDHGFQSLVRSGGKKVVRYLVRRRALSRENIKKIATKRNKIWYMDQEDPFCIPPLEDDTLNEAFEDYQKKHTPEQPFICEIENCHILGSGAVGLTNDGRLIDETLSGNFPGRKSLGREKHNFYLRGLGMKRAQSTFSSDKAFFPLISEYHSYYHWMVEYLPKLKLLEYYNEETGEDPTILIESNPRDFVQETLSAVGYGSGQYKEWHGTELQVENLVVPMHRCHRFNYQNPRMSDYNPSHADLLWLRDRMKLNRDFDRVDNEIIYISRQEVPEERGRQVVNYKPLINVVQEFGGEAYILEEMDFEHQLEIFAGADIIVGPHGAGLLNMIFAEDPTIVELFPESVLKPHFYFISEIMGFEYKPIVTESQGNNLVVDETRFKNHMKSIIQDKQ